METLFQALQRKTTSKEILSFLESWRFSWEKLHDFPSDIFFAFVPSIKRSIDPFVFSEKKRKKMKNEKKKSLYPLSFTLYRSVIRVLRIMLKKKKKRERTLSFRDSKIRWILRCFNHVTIVRCKGRRKKSFCHIMWSIKLLQYYLAFNRPIERRNLNAST